MAVDQVTTTPTSGRMPPAVAAAPMVFDDPALRAIFAPHLHLTEEEAGALLAGLPRADLLHCAESALRVARERDGLTCCGLPNRNALLIAAAALLQVLYAGPRLATEGGAA